MGKARGMSLIDVVVGVALLLILFLALFGVLKASLAVSALAKTKAAATALAENQMEYLRGLDYDTLGTEGGIPAGPVAQRSASTVDGVAYAVSTFIEYADDPADGTGASDTNGITTDYKIARVSVSWSFYGTPEEIALVSTFAPPGIENTDGGGTLEIEVVDAAGAGIPDASVHIVDASLTPAVDLTAYTDASGRVELPGALPSAQYQVYVAKAGYSSAQTYARDGENANPSPGYFTVAKDDTTTGTFAIDRLASFSLYTYYAGTSTALADAAYTLTGAKTIGTTAAGAPIYKNALDLSTDGAGADHESLEWDDYALAAPGYDIADACPAPPYALSPAESFSAALYLASSTANALLLTVADAAGQPVAGAAVELAGSGFEETATTSSCGNAYFGGLASATYVATASAAGYASASSSVAVSGQTFSAVSFP
ncbi:MAG TPA: carboxypeptidase-like regulatory domain-containing protein [Candidatus Paceibacterota bacterium]|nr:carboxypeptidase-like regulatory domain-containing protein [Candidatus Paceibacterota bacterium]